MSDVHWFREFAQVFRLAVGARERSAAELIELARRRTGLSDLSGEPIEDALERLLSAYRGEAELNLLGRLATHWDNLRLLTNRLILRDRERADPTVLQRPLEAPIFIMGLPRSGTSFLHRALAEDTDNQVLRSWQAVYPYPDHPAAGRGAGPDKVQSDFGAFHVLAPELKKIHPIGARMPQECGEITAHSFRSLRFDATYGVPSYRRWLNQTGHRFAYRCHRRFLQHLQGEQPRRWVLKSPDHVFAMDALRAAYPDARIVFSHRDPLKVLPSVANLTEVMQRPFLRRIDRHALGRQVADDWADGAQRMIEAASGDLWPADRIFHVHFKALTADPVGVIGQLYDHFDLPMTSQFESRLAAYVASHPNGGYGRNVYRFEDFGLAPGEQAERFADYMRAFDVDSEVVAG